MRSKLVAPIPAARNAQPEDADGAPDIRKRILQELRDNRKPAAPNSGAAD